MIISVKLDDHLVNADDATTGKVVLYYILTRCPPDKNIMQ